MERQSSFIVIFGVLLVKVAEAQNTTNFNCTIVGFFEIYDGTCKNYYMCIDNGESLTSVTLSCASSAIFDPDQDKCVSKNTTTCKQTSLCSRYGRFPVQNANCNKYYLCYWSGSSYTMMGNLSCPNTLVFEPTSEKCVSSQKYVCPGIQSNYTNTSIQL